MRDARPPFDRPGRRRLRGLTAALVLAGLAACGKFQARVEMKKGNAFYRNEQYREALAQFQRGLELDPDARFAWRSVGLSAMALYRPGDDSAAQRGYADTAIDAFRRYRAAFPGDRKVEDYLLTTLVNSARYDEALKLLDEETHEHPGDREIETAIVNTLIKAGQLDRALARARSIGKPDAEWFYAIAVAAWRRSYDDPRIDAADRSAIVELGLESCRQALQIEPTADETMTYYNLLFREKAKLALDPDDAARWSAVADEWLAKALSARAQGAAKAGL